jgi:hypothetical protein
MSAPWDEIAPYLHERAYFAIADIEAHHADEPHPVPVLFTEPHEALFARLLGPDDQIIRDGMRLAEPLTEIKLPIMRRLRWEEATESGPIPSLLADAAIYRIQPAQATVGIACEFCEPPDGVTPLLTTQLWIARFLLYRRVLP